ncbi:Uncharacterised protein [Bordetella pertussis]|nr:Uncharacterised protein [Bordetella pertussis]CFE00859.1 Uncharacterised protein [Bordetella pertussis]CFL77377.1 Uncharacterised protein [Bordetella pertussis]CFL85283.1 Uncharacterised protein [Bordetella pertussis]CFL85941.1 Uncharacterised protein [Bordetella pertussis]
MLIAPLWLMTATGPSAGATSPSRVAKVARAPLLKLARPWVFGPSRRMPAAAAAAFMCFCACRPGSPVSANPDEMTTHTRTPSRAPSRTACTAASPATQTSSMSIGTFTASRLCQAAMPWTRSRPGLIGRMRPW